MKRFFILGCLLLQCNLWGVVCSVGGALPTPDMTSELLKDYRALGDENGTREFVYHEKSRGLILRTENNSLEYLPLTGQISELSFTDSTDPILPIKDSSERFILTAPNKGMLQMSQWVYNLEKKHWKRFNYPKIELTPVYWEKNSLHFVRMPDYVNQRLETYRYDYPSKRAWRKCSLSSVSSQGLKLAQGHQYPYIYFYTQKERQSGAVSDVDLLQLDVLNCDLRTVETVQWNIKSQVKRVIVFQDPRKVAFYYSELDQNRVLWVNSGNCRLYGIEDKKVIALKSPYPAVALTRKDRLDVLDLNTGRLVNLINDQPIEYMQDSDVVLSTDGSEMIFAGQYSHSSSKNLFKAIFAF